MKSQHRKEASMKIIYSNNKTKRICNDYKTAVKKLGSQVADKLMDLMNAIESFPNLFDIHQFPQYGLHSLIGNRNGQYSMVISKKTKWRLIIYPLDENENKLLDKSKETEMLKMAVMVEIVEVSEHYA